VPVFVDTNVFVYAQTVDTSEKHRAARAWVDHLWRTGQGRTSTQVLQEFYAVTTRKLHADADTARNETRDLMAWSPIAVDPLAIEGAWAVEDRYSLSFWDALIVASAHLARCETLLTEDLQHGMDFDGITVVSPFARTPGEAS